MSSTRLTVVAAALVGLGVTGLDWWRSHDVGPVQRGARLAAKRGCLACHGPAGRLADPDGAGSVGTVPSFEHEDLTAYARNEGEIREWILDGKPRRLRRRGGRASRPSDARLVRPVVGARGGPPRRRVKAVRFDCCRPALPAGGREPGRRLPHRRRHPNPGSLKGHIPSWTGKDFLELARDDGEIREWIRTEARGGCGRTRWRVLPAAPGYPDARLRGTRRRSGDPADHRLHPVAEA
jgi:hypothetical protein